MSLIPTTVTPPLHAYLLAKGTREPEVARQLREATEKRADREMQSSIESAELLAFLVELTAARRIVEVGTFTGYATLRMAMAIPADGRIVACDIDDGPLALGRAAWARAGVAERIDVRIAPALDTLAALRRDGGDGTVDLIFIDADKTNYPAYYEPSLALLRPGGLLVVDNVFWGGAIANAADRSEETLAIRAINDRIHADSRVSVVMLPIADGVTLARKR
jgi:predicted O-methyltransferase YrrM